MRIFSSYFDEENSMMALPSTIGAYLMVAASAAAIASGEYYRIWCFCIIGGCLGGYIGMVLASNGLTNKERNLRWLVNSFASVLFAFPLTRIFCGWIGEDVTPEFALAGGGAVGIFGVMALIVMRKLLPAMLSGLVRVWCRGIGIPVPFKHQKDNINDTT